MGTPNVNMDHNRFIISLVKDIDTHFKKILSETQDIALILDSIKPVNDDIYNVISLTSRGTLSKYCQEYQHFGYVIKLILRFADDIADGKINLN